MSELFVLPAALCVKLQSRVADTVNCADIQHLLLKLSEIIRFICCRGRKIEFHKNKI